MKPATQSSTRLFLALASSLNMAMLGGSTVLCMGSDGHVAFELAGSRCCDSENTPTHETPCCPEPDVPDPCSGCVAWTLGSAFGPLPVPRGVAVESPLSAHAVALAYEGSPAGALRQGEAVWASTSWMGAKRLEHLRTTVLRR